jgi:phenylpyruvate tautomerase PptA (4-oxalocrotonate tautomerase family)
VPIVDVEMVGETVVTSEVTQRLADAVGGALSSRPGGTWVRVRQLDPSQYAENGGVPDGVRPVFVTVLERVRPGGEELAEKLARVTTVVAEITGCPAENVHVLFEDGAAGRLAFGGRLVE